MLDKRQGKEERRGSFSWATERRIDAIADRWPAIVTVREGGARWSAEGQWGQRGRGREELLPSVVSSGLDVPPGCTSLDILTASLGATAPSHRRSAPRDPSATPLTTPFPLADARCSRADARESARTLARRPISTLPGDLNWPLRLLAPRVDCAAGV